MDDSRYLQQLEEGDSGAFEHAFTKFFPRLRAAVSRRSRQYDVGSGSATDYAMSAFRSFWRGLQAGNFEIGSEQQLWGLLNVIATRKSYAKKRSSSEKRQVLTSQLSESQEAQYEECADRDLYDDPSFLAELEDQKRRLLLFYSDMPKVRDTLELRLSGWSTKQLAEHFGTLERTIQLRVTNARKRYERFHLISEFARLKFDGRTYLEIANERGSELAWVETALNRLLDLWSREPLDRYNGPAWIELLRVYFQTGELQPPKDLGFLQRRAFTPDAIQTGLAIVRNAWDQKIFDDWKKELDLTWDEYHAKGRS